MAYIEVTNVTSSSISARIAGLDTNYSYSGRTASLFLYEDSSQDKYFNLPAYASRSQTVTFTGLSSATEYTIGAAIVGIQGSSNVSLSKTQSTIEGGLPYITG